LRQKRGISARSRGGDCGCAVPALKDRAAFDTSSHGCRQPRVGRTEVARQHEHRRDSSPQLRTVRVSGASGPVWRIGSSWISARQRGAALHGRVRDGRAMADALAQSGDGSRQSIRLTRCPPCSRERRKAADAGARNIRAWPAAALLCLESVLHKDALRQRNIEAWPRATGRRPDRTARPGRVRVRAETYLSLCHIMHVY
jgi:hypothetical protein